jgi:Di-haem oxidoreductase, putative peroxidase
MASPFRSRVAQGFLLALALVPLWKSIEPFFRPGPKAISKEASRLGRELFTHEWTKHDPLASGDGLGPVFNASSCVECHNQGGTGGGGPVDKNVTVYRSRDTIS